MVRVLICGPAASDACTAGHVVGEEDSVPDEEDFVTERVATGARIQAILVGGYSQLAVSEPLTPLTQPVLSPRDVAEWRWIVYAYAPGEYVLTLSINVLDAATDALLIPSKVTNITVVAEGPVISTSVSMWSRVWQAMQKWSEIFQVLASMGVVWLVTSVLRTIRRRFRRHPALGVATAGQARSELSAPAPSDDSSSQAR